MRSYLKKWIAVTTLLGTPVASDAQAIIVGSEAIRVELNEQRAHRLENVQVGAVTFVSGGAFPTFQIFNQEGTERVLGAQSAFFTDVQNENVPGGVRVVYSGEGFAVSVTYRLVDGRILITVKPEKETVWKIRGVTDGGSLASIASTNPEAEATGFLLRPYRGGELIPMTASREVVTETHPQSWDYNASFVGLGLQGQGLIVRSPQFGAMWTAGTGNVRGIHSLHAGLTIDFRPRRDQPGPYSFWNIALCEPQLDIELIPVGDVTGDGIFTWADIGVDYRRRFIRRNPYLDPHIPGAVMGKIDMSLPYENVQRYDALIEEIRAIDFAPQIWWLVGAHTAPEFDFIAPPHSPKPHPGHNGPDGYDYFRFKADAAKANARIGLHEIFDDTSVLNPAEWNRVPVRLQEFGETMGTWSCTMPTGEKFSAISKSLKPVVEDGSFLRELEEHFKQWDVRRGDTWHWDVFASVGGRSDFHPEHPVTHGEDFRLRIGLLRDIQERTGAYLTHEGLQEGLAEHSSYTWVTRAIPELVSEFPGGRGVPLQPVLFQGTTYYGAPWKPAWGLLMGGNVGSESTSLDVDKIRQSYFSQNTFWSKICDRTVANMTEIENGWKVDYDQGGSLTVDLAAMTFVLDVDGATYTPENPPPSPFGYTARLVNGRYEIEAPPQGAGNSNTW